MTDPSEPLGLDTIQASASGHTDVPALIAEINRLRAGEDPTPPEPGTQRTPGQWIYRWNGLTADQRHAKIAALIRQLAIAERCFLMDHEGLREELDAAHQHISRLNAQLVRIRDLAHHWKALAPTGITALCGNAILAVLDQPNQPDTDPQTTTGAHHETPTISTHRIGWVTWQAVVTLDECSCDAAQAHTRDRARARMLQAHTAAVQAGRCPA